jgi:hypothetical protein
MFLNATTFTEQLEDKVLQHQKIKVECKEKEKTMHCLSINKSLNYKTSQYNSVINTIEVNFKKSIRDTKLTIEDFINNLKYYKASDINIKNKKNQLIYTIDNLILVTDNIKFNNKFKYVEEGEVKVNIIGLKQKLSYLAEEGFNVSKILINTISNDINKLEFLTIQEKKYLSEKLIDLFINILNEKVDLELKISTMRDIQDLKMKLNFKLNNAGGGYSDFLLDLKIKNYFEEIYEEIPNMDLIVKNLKFKGFSAIVREHNKILKSDIKYKVIMDKIDKYIKVNANKNIESLKDNKQLLNFYKNIVQMNLNFINGTEEYEIEYHNSSNKPVSVMIEELFTFLK